MRKYCIHHVDLVWPCQSFPGLSDRKKFPEIFFEWIIKAADSDIMERMVFKSIHDNSNNRIPIILFCHCFSPSISCICSSESGTVFIKFPFNRIECSWNPDGTGYHKVGHCLLKTCDKWIQLGNSTWASIESGTIYQCFVWPIEGLLCIVSSILSNVSD